MAGRRHALILRAIGWLARLAVGATFIYAGWMKARDPAAFIRDIWNFQLVPEPAAYWMAAFLPYWEMVAGAAFITPWYRRGAGLLLALMLLVFLGAMLSAAARGLDVSCGCFGYTNLARPDLGRAVTRDLLLLGALAFSTWTARPASPK